MKKLLTVIILCLLTFSFSKTQNGYVITPGVGTKDLQVGKTKIKSAFRLLGKYDKYTMGIIDRVNADAIHINRYIYATKGLKLITTTDEAKGEDIENAVLDAIEFEQPASVTTDNNIVLGKSKSDEISKAFGKPDDAVKYADVTFLVYSKKGISFLVDNQISVPIKLIVYERNKRPSFDFY